MSDNIDLFPPFFDEVILFLLQFCCGFHIAIQVLSNRQQHHCYYSEKVSDGQKCNHIKQPRIQCISESQQFLWMPYQNWSEFFKKKNPSILINFPHHFTIPQSLVSSSIRLRFARRMFVVRLCLLLGKCIDDSQNDGKI